LSGKIVVDDLSALLASGRRFGTLYADPPWLYDNQGTRAATSKHYSGLTVDELCALPIRELAAPDAHLHLWVTNSFLFEVFRIFEAWGGFEFDSSFVWIKREMGLGNYWRNATELLLTAVRGSARQFQDLPSRLICSRGRHSAKPEQVRCLIEKASPAPRLELFGRRPSPRWTVWGNQIEVGLFDRDAVVLNARQP
jgi:N6-adenosine-specific RNA methylase IME4